MFSTILLCATSACDKEDERSSDRSAERIVTAPNGTFSQEFERVGSVIPEQSPDEPIARLSGIDVRADGAFMIGDVSDARVTLFDRDGRILVRMGREGDGPGEFRAPRYPRFGPHGRIYVADPQTARVQIFDEAGEYIKGIPLSLPWIHDFAVRPDGSFLFLAPNESTGNVLVYMDSSGTVTHQRLPIANVLPEDEPPHPAWGSLRRFFMSVRGDTAFVSSSASNRVWIVELLSGRVRTDVLHFEDHVPPHIPRDEPPSNARALFEWAGSVHMASAISAGAGNVYLPFVQGVLNYGDPMVLLSRSPAGEWKALAEAPPSVFAYGDSLLVIEDPAADYLTLGVYQRRR